MKERIRYKYRKESEGFRLDKVRCPTCGSININWTKPANSIDWNGQVVLLAECWSGSTYEHKPKHLFLIRLKKLPTVIVEKVRSK